MTLHIRRSALLSLIGALALSSGIAADQGGRGFGPPGGQGGFGGPGGPGMQEEIKLVKQFDKDGDKILNSAERKAAKAYLESSNSGGGGRMGRMGGPRGGGNTGAGGVGVLRLADERRAPQKDAAQQIGVAAEDIVLPRYHGLGPLTGTQLDSILRNLGVTTIVGVGVSVNIGMTDFAFSAVNHGYQFVMPRDAVAGVPADYARDVIDQTLSLVATVTTTAAVLDAWA